MCGPMFHAWKVKAPEMIMDIGIGCLGGNSEVTACAGHLNPRLIPIILD